MIDNNKLNNIHKLSVDDCLIIMHECAERIGLVEVDDCKDILHISKRQVYYHIESGELKHFTIGKRKFPCINK